MHPRDVPQFSSLSYVRGPKRGEATRLGSGRSIDTGRIEVPAACMTDQQVIAEEAEGCPAILNLSGVGEFLLGSKRT